MIVYKTVYVFNGQYFSSYMNKQHFSNPYLQQEYIFNKTVYMQEPFFPLYAWATEKQAQRAIKRDKTLCILQCSATRYYGRKIYNITNETSFILLKSPEYRDLFLVDLFKFPLEDLGIVLCSSITPRELL